MFASRPAPSCHALFCGNSALTNWLSPLYLTPVDEHRLKKDTVNNRATRIPLGKTLRFKITSILLGLFILYGLMIALLANRIVLSSFLQMESDDSDQHMNRLHEILRREQEDVSRYAAEWAQWDDAYEFVQTGDPAFVETNLYDEYLSEMDLELIYFLDADARVVWGTGYVTETGEKFEHELFRRGSLDPDSELVAFQSTGADRLNDSTTGFVSTDRGIMTITAHPIVTSNGQGPIAGSLIFGRILEDQRIRDLVQLDIHVYSIADPASRENLFAGLLQNGDHYYKDDSEYRRLYHIENGIQGEPLFAIELNYPRTIVQQGKQVIGLAFPFLSLVGLGVLLLIRLALGRLILAPLKMVFENLEAAISDGNYDHRLELKRQDEVGVLAGTLDRLMLTIHEQTSSLTELNHKLTLLADTDQLTSLPNRRKFNEHLGRELRRVARNRRDNRHSGTTGFILCDIDHFKPYNDTYGHQAGDDCLTRIAQTMATCISRPMDLVSRFGGEEFACILPDTDLVGARVVAEKIRESILELEIEHSASPVSPYVTISLGISSLSSDQELDSVEIIRLADEALYRAKAQGRNTVSE
jgi:diguanylate cyclase (GGDEF)-like protein